MRTFIARALVAVPLAALFLMYAGGCNFNYGVETVVGSGVIKTEDRKAAGFTAVRLDGVGSVVIKQTGRESLAITTDDNILPLIESEVSDGTLHLSVKDSTNLSPSDSVKYAIEVKSLDSLVLNGAGSIRASEIQGESLSVSVNGVGDVVAAGNVASLTISVSGTGGFRGNELIAKRATASLNGIGDITVHATETLDVAVSGTGSVTYQGGAKVTESISGVGEVRKGE